VTCEEQILKALENVGVDVTCGACCEIGFTGITRAPHTCRDGKKTCEDCGTVLGTFLGDLEEHAVECRFFPAVGGYVIEVKLTYFKESGKYYSEGSYMTSKRAFHEIVDEVTRKLRDGDCAGLADHGMVRNGFTALVEIQDDKLGVPFLVYPRNLM